MHRVSDINKITNSRDLVLDESIRGENHNQFNSKIDYMSKNVLMNLMNLLMMNQKYNFEQ